MTNTALLGADIWGINAHYDNQTKKAIPNATKHPADMNGIAG